MECPEAPTLEVKSAEGMGHAWFCDKDFNIWKNSHDVDYAKKIKDGIASQNFRDNPNPNIKEAVTVKSKRLLHWWNILGIRPSKEKT